MIIRWQIDWDIVVGTMKIYQSAFVRDHVIKKGLTNCNINIISIKAGLSIEITDSEDYNETDFRTY